MRSPIRMVVVDDHPLARQGLAAMLNAHEERFQVVAQAASVAEALALLRADPVAIVLTDLHFEPEGSPSGIDLVRHVKAQHAGTGVVLITSEMNNQFLLEAFDAGVDAYLHKHAEAAEIMRALDAVASGFTHFPVQLRSALDKRLREPVPTPRELDILPYVARGMTAKEIGRELTRIDPQQKVVAGRTIEVHKGNIRQKFRLDEANALIPFAIEYCQLHRIDYKGLKIHTRRGG